MAIALSASALILGTAGDRLRRRGVSLSATFAVRDRARHAGAARAGPALARPGLAAVDRDRWHRCRHRPELRDPRRAVPQVGIGPRQRRAQSPSYRRAFAVQVGVGFIVELWPVEAGRHPPIAYQTALGINLALQVAAFLWFVRPQRHAVVVRLRAHPIHGIARSLGITPGHSRPISSCPAKMERAPKSRASPDKCLAASSIERSGRSIIDCHVSSCRHARAIPRALLQEHFDLDVRQQFWRLLSTNSARNIPISSRDRSLPRTTSLLLQGGAVD